MWGVLMMWIRTSWELRASLGLLGFLLRDIRDSIIESAGRVWKFPKRTCAG